MIEIPLTQGQTTIIDDVDVNLSEMKWYARYSKSTEGFYVERRNKIHGKRSTLYLHRLVLENMLGRPLKKGEIADHINHDTLNNRRENLRLATYTQNQANRRKIKNTASKYKGVSWHKKGNKWRADIKYKKSVYLGLFSDEIEAAKAYDEYAHKTFGVFANLNFPEDYGL